MGGTYVGDFGNSVLVRWYREDDGTWTKIRSVQDTSFKIKGHKVLEANVSEREYFKRQLANDL